MKYSLCLNRTGRSVDIFSLHDVHFVGESKRRLYSTISNEISPNPVVPFDVQKYIKIILVKTWICSNYMSKFAVLLGCCVCLHLRVIPVFAIFQKIVVYFCSSNTDMQKFESFRDQNLDFPKFPQKSEICRNNPIPYPNTL